MTKTQYQKVTKTLKKQSFQRVYEKQASLNVLIDNVLCAYFFFNFFFVKNSETFIKVFSQPFSISVVKSVICFAFVFHLFCKPTSID